MRKHVYTILRVKVVSFVFEKNFCKNSLLIYCIECNETL